MLDNFLQKALVTNRSAFDSDAQVGFAHFLRERQTDLRPVQKRNLFLDLFADPEDASQFQKLVGMPRADRTSLRGNRRVRQEHKQVR